jgi:peptidoglycan/LPS O-acetylase OafA/YrhL
LKYEPSLDGLRAIAIAAVFAYHCSARALPGGWAGVDVFFVLSGYLITTILASEVTRSGRIDLKRFYLNRVLRLAPAFTCLLAFMVFLGVCADSGAQRLAIFEAIGVSATYMMNWNRAFDWLPQYVLGHTWSLSTEEQFYLLWPPALLLIRHRRPLCWTIALIALVTLWRFHVALSGADPERTYNGFDTHADSLLIGCTLALIKPGQRIIHLAGRTAVLPVAGLAAIFACMGLRTIETQTVGLTVAALCSAWIIVAALDHGWLARLLSLRPLVFTGRISYGLYLWHFPIIHLAQAHPHLPRIAVLSFAFLSYPVAIASYLLIEQPFLNMKSRRRKPPVSGRVTVNAQS